MDHTPPDTPDPSTHIARTRVPSVPWSPVPNGITGVPRTPATASDSGVGMVGGFERLELDGELGRGGLGVVYAGRDPVLRREIAIKVLQQPADARPIARFLEEAQITGQLEHPNIVPVHEFGFDAQGRPYLTMKRIRGRDFFQVLTTAHRQLDLEAEASGGNSARVVREHLLPLLDVFERVCDAVAFAHSHHVLHRDLKPANVMVGDYGEVVVVDWGLAKLLDPASPGGQDSTTSRHSDGHAGLHVAGAGARAHRGCPQ